MSAPTPTAAQLDAYVRARLAIAGFDLSLLPTEYSAETGVPTQDQLLASLRSFMTSTPPALSGWAPPAHSPEYAQQAAPPLLYPSITQAWNGKVDER
ncbi:hypothetical protein ABZX30_29230 [Streptomyces sp. NPDC004542]|uniref:hypothetical protein n=1 Tax=Streptomyces sp. NPDC004542 TaxID=3154281 RepID=UPI0033B82D84